MEGDNYKFQQKNQAATLCTAMDVQYNESEFLKMLERGDFQSEQFNVNPSNHLRLIECLNKLKLPDETPVPHPVFLLVEKVIKFYGTPILICLSNFYAKLLKQETLVEVHSNQLKNIASLVKAILEEHKFDELRFFFFKGTSRKKYTLPPKAKEEQDFFKYILSLGMMYAELQKKIKQGKNNKSEKEFRNDLNDAMNQFLEADMNRKMNIFESNYQNYFKSRAMHKINQIESMIVSSDPEQQKRQPEKPIVNKKTPEKREEVVNNERTPLCCRTFFYKAEKIPQPQTLHFEYKHYKFPFRNQLLTVLRKTICGFLNAEGGTIFIGIAEPIQTKRRIVEGGFYDESIKEDVLRCFRRIAQKIEPDIITHKLYSVSFVPIKNDLPPYSYISGKYVVKVNVRYGQRDDIYSYKGEDGGDMFSFRTENQVLHRHGRQVLNALRERIKNPLPIPQPLHQGPCQKPEQGKPVYSGEKAFDRSYEQPRQMSERYTLPKGKHYRPMEKPTLNNNNTFVGRKPEQKPYRGNRFGNSHNNGPQKVWSYLILGLTEEQVRGFLKKNDFLPGEIKAEKKGTKESLVYLLSEQKNRVFEHLKTKLESSSAEIIQVSQKVQVQQGQPSYIYQTIIESLTTKNIKFEILDKQGQGLFDFTSVKDSSDAFLMIKEFGIPVTFTL